MCTCFLIIKRLFKLNIFISLKDLTSLNLLRKKNVPTPFLKFDKIIHNNCYN